MEPSHSPLDLDVGSPPPPRERQIEALKGSKDKPFDVLVVGGGATGAGCALDATTRGLRTALVEREDFASGTSSRSTKLIHGGVRYLEKAVFNLDYGQLKLVFEALQERRAMIHNAPYLSTSLPIMTPCYSLWEVPYYYMGLKMYDLVAGSRALTWSYFMSAKESQRLFPTLSQQRKDDHRSLKGTIVYYDGQFNDARMNVALACTAARAGATVLNHAEVTGLIKDERGKVVGAKVRDALTGSMWDVHAKVVVNATGPFSDALRHMSDPKASKMIEPSSGVHITLPDYYSPENIGMIVPKTKDGRVVFMLPWLGHTIAGTTDAPTDVTPRPQPTEQEIQFILDTLKDFLTVRVRRSDVMSAWSGIRPLAADPTASSTESVSRDHVVCVESDGLVTISGGKWTTYRRMAQDTIDLAARVAGLKAGPCITERVMVVGSKGWSPNTFTEVAQNYVVPHRPGAIDTRVAIHLSNSYGTKAFEITRIAEKEKLGKRLVRGHPLLEAEVAYCCRNEYCETIEDFIARRTRLVFLDTLATREALPWVAELMAREHGWSDARRRSELQKAESLLETFDSTERRNMGNTNAAPVNA